MRDPAFLAADHPSDPGVQKGNMKGAQWEPSFFAAAHPSDPGPRKETGAGRRPPVRPKPKKDEGSPTGAQLFGRGPPGNMKGAQQEPSFLAATHPADPGVQKGNMKGAQCEPSFLAAAHPSDPGAQKEGNMKGAYPTQEPRKEI